MHDTLTGYLDHWAAETPDEVWLRDRYDDDITEWTWKQVQEQA